MKTPTPRLISYANLLNSALATIAWPKRSTTIGNQATTIPSSTHGSRTKPSRPNYLIALHSIKDGITTKRIATAPWSYATTLATVRLRNWVLGALRTSDIIYNMHVQIFVKIIC